MRQNKIQLIISIIAVIVFIFTIWVFIKNNDAESDSIELETTKVAASKEIIMEPKSPTIRFSPVDELGEADSEEPVIDPDIFTETPVDDAESIDTEPQVYETYPEYTEETLPETTYYDAPIEETTPAYVEETTAYETDAAVVAADDGFYLTYEEVDASVYNPNNLYGLSEYEIYLIAKIVEDEAGAYYLSLEQKLLTACVVINLMNSNVLPETTIEGVIHHPGAYYSVKVGYFNSIVPTARSLAIANYIANNGIICPPNVCYMANFPQGSGTYRMFYVPEQANSYPYSYFCYE